MLVHGAYASMRSFLVQVRCLKSEAAQILRPFDGTVFRLSRCAPGVREFLLYFELIETEND